MVWTGCFFSICIAVLCILRRRLSGAPYRYLSWFVNPTTTWLMILIIILVFMGYIIINLAIWGPLCRSQVYTHVFFPDQWPFQDPKLEVPTIYKAYFLGLCKGISPENMANMVLTYLHFRILKFPLTWCVFGFSERRPILFPQPGGKPKSAFAHPP